MKKQVSKALLVKSEGLCPTCGSGTRPFNVQITSISAESGKWLAKGRGRVSEAKNKETFGSCPACGMYYSMVMREIPIQCTEFGCPDCKEKENLEYQVESINVEKDNFSFNATISCKKCKTKKSLSKILTNLLKIIKIEVKPTGITLQKAAE